MKKLRIKTSIWITALMFLVCNATTIHAQKNIKKVDLNVLYVGGSANWEKDAFETPEAKANDVARRTASFASMLKTYFTQVTTVDASDYNQALSDQYDVTVMDGTPKPISERQIIKDAAGKVTKYVPPGYLTEDFDKPVLFIGELGERMGRSIGLKLDWYCLCLDAHAHHYKKEHPIFRTPFKVQLTEEVLPTPEDAFHYAYYSDSSIPKTTTMWRVQTKGFATDDNFRIGMVSRPWGFEDSPDAESISSGVCQKTLDAVAIGRHGNFFHWGFAASPEFMTAEAKDVLANAVVYISKFNGQRPVARKYNDRRATKEYLKELKYLSTRESYEDRIKSNEEFDKRMFAEQKAALEKQAKGGRLSDREKMTLNYTAQPKISFEAYLKRYQDTYYEKFGTNTTAYAKYYDENLPYFYADDASYVITVDEDVKSLGIPNTDIRLLEKCISMLEQGKDTAKAKRILDRYTLLDFQTTAEWRTWYTKNKDRIFFTQSGGFYFMVDSPNKNEPSNNYKSNTSVN